MMIPISIDTELHIGRHLIHGDFLSALCKRFANKSVIVVDSYVKDLYGDELSHKLEAQIFEVPRGEEAKTREVKQEIEDQMLKKGYGRDTVLIGLGGGSTTDLAGFIASTYLRGIPLILIPTTLLGMVDASIGGKTAVNTSLGKNLIGTFYHPKAIISDLEVLKTLPEKEKINGLSEIIKMGLISDPEILSLFEKESFSDELVLKASKAKIAIVTQDPLEEGLRRVLNFGHTIGHGLETISSFELSHGEAVAMGCVVESYLSHLLKFLPKEDFFSIEALYQAQFKGLCLPKKYDRQSFLEALSFDKKKSADGVRFVLIDKIGHPLFFDGEYCLQVKEQDLEKACIYMESHYG